MFNRETISRDVSIAIANVTPPAAVSAASITEGFSAQDWVPYVTIGYVILQAAYLLWKWRREANSKKP